jgi:hypothetical protein
MYPNYGFHREMAQDRQSQLRRDAGVEGPAAAHLAEIAANQRAEMAANRQRAHPLSAASSLVFALAAHRPSVRVRPGLSGV